jgi:hypothetical protein
MDGLAGLLSGSRQLGGLCGNPRQDRLQVGSGYPAAPAEELVELVVAAEEAIEEDADHGRDHLDAGPRPGELPMDPIQQLAIVLPHFRAPADGGQELGEVPELLPEEEAGARVSRRVLLQPCSDALPQILQPHPVSGGRIGLRGTADEPGEAGGTVAEEIGHGTARRRGLQVTAERGAGPPPLQGSLQLDGGFLHLKDLPWGSRLPDRIARHGLSVSGDARSKAGATPGRPETADPNCCHD